MADITSVRLPTRYEDLDPTFRGRLKPVPALIDLVQSANQSMRLSGGIRFLPLLGSSGSGKSCAARELGTHLPDCDVFQLTPENLGSREALETVLRDRPRTAASGELVIAVVDQHEEVVADSLIHSRFVEWLSLLDRGALRTSPTLVIWLTTSPEFRDELIAATRRNRRLLLARDFELSGPERNQWPMIIEETFEFHNSGTPLADFEVLPGDLEQVAKDEDTLGDAIAEVGSRLTAGTSPLQDFSKMQVIMLWPVTDAARISRITNFTQAREGYKLDWNAWYRELSRPDRTLLPLEAYNRARLYFDMRLVPIAAADLQPLCRDLDDDADPLHGTYLDRFAKTHLYSLIAGSWEADKYSPLRERDSVRARDARDWYATVTTRPTALGNRIARVLRDLGLDAGYETEIASKFRTVKADVLVHSGVGDRPVKIIELKAFSPTNTMPSTIRDQVKSTLKKHAELVGFLARTWDSDGCDGARSRIALGGLGRFDRDHVCRRHRWRRGRRRGRLLRSGTTGRSGPSSS